MELMPPLLTICGNGLLPIAVPLLAYWIYCSRRFRNDLKGKVVLITGASSGLGEALAHAFYKYGCKLILAARRVDQLERVKTQILNSQSYVNETFEPIVIALDLSKLNEIHVKAKKILKIHNEINILINNAGISYRGNIAETTIDVHMDVMKVNYFGQIALTNALLPSLIKCKGHIVAINSIQGRIALPNRSAYAASKHAFQAYMDCLRSDIPDVKVTVVQPGYIKTNLSINAVTSTGQLHGVLDTSTSNGYSPEYVAEKILKAVILNKQELMIAPLFHKLAVIARVLMPSLFFRIIKLYGKKGK